MDAFKNLVSKCGQADDTMRKQQQEYKNSKYQPSLFYLDIPHGGCKNCSNSNLGGTHSTIGKENRQPAAQKLKLEYFYQISTFLCRGILFRNTLILARSSQKLVIQHVTRCKQHSKITMEYLE